MPFLPKNSPKKEERGPGEFWAGSSSDLMTDWAKQCGSAKSLMVGSEVSSCKIANGVTRTNQQLRLN